MCYHSPRLRARCLEMKRESKHMDFQGKRTLIMGLGGNGSGIASARYAAQHGAIVRVTDLRSAELLAPSIRSLAGLPIEYVLGQHREEDFLWAEIVIPVPCFSFSLSSGIPFSCFLMTICR